MSLSESYSKRLSAQVFLSESWDILSINSAILNLPARAFVVSHVKVELPKRNVGYNQEVLPSAEARVMNSNNWQRQQMDKRQLCGGA